MLLCTSSCTSSTQHFRENIILQIWWYWMWLFLTKCYSFMCWEHFPASKGEWCSWFSQCDIGTFSSAKHHSSTTDQIKALVLVFSWRVSMGILSVFAWNCQSNWGGGEKIMSACQCASVAGTSLSPEGNITTDYWCSSDCWRSCQHMPCSAAVGLHCCIKIRFFFCSMFCSYKSWKSRCTQNLKRRFVFTEINHRDSPCTLYAPLNEITDDTCQLSFTCTL